MIRTLLASVLFFSPVAFGGGQIECAGYTSRSTTHAFCLAYHDNKQRCSVLDEPLQSWCEGIATGSTGHCSRLDDHDESICRALISDSYSRCTTHLDRDSERGAENAAFCTALVKQETSYCSRAGNLAIDCRALVDILDAKLRAELEDIGITRAESDSSVLSATEEVLDAEGFIERPNIVEDTFIHRFHREFPDDRSSSATLRKLFRDGARFSDTGELVNLHGEQMYERRKLEIDTLTRSPIFSKDLATLDIGEQRVAWMVSGECPLSFDHPRQYQQFQKELKGLLKEVGLDDAFVTLKGTSTTFYSENPRKPLGHHFDANLKEPADLDLGLGSKKLIAALAGSGVEASAKIPTIFHTADTLQQVPVLAVFADRWGSMLNRPVNFVALTSGGRPSLGKADYLVVGH